MPNKTLSRPHDPSMPSKAKDIPPAGILLISFQTCRRMLSLQKLYNEENLPSHIPAGRHLISNHETIKTLLDDQGIYLQAGGKNEANKAP